MPPKKNQSSKSKSVRKSAVSKKGASKKGSAEQISAAGEEVSNAGEEVSNAGEVVSAAGEEVSAAGEEVSAAGEEVSAAGEVVSAAGDDVNAAVEKESRAASQKSLSRYDENQDDQEEEKVEVEEKLDNAEQILAEALENEILDQDDQQSLQQKATMETKGLNLGDGLEDVVNKSMAMTEMIKPPGSDDKLFDKNNENFEKYTDINQDQVKDDRTDLDNLGFMDEELDIQPTELQKNIKLVKDSWVKVEKIGLDKCGQAFFRNIFKLAPTTLLLFSFKTEPNIYKSEAFKAHALKAMSTVGVAVAGLDDLETLIPILKRLGESHVKHGVKPEHYPVVGEALIMTLKAGMKKSWNDELEKAWGAIYQIVQDTMISDHYDIDDPADVELTDERIKIVQSTWNQIITSEEVYEPVGLAILKELFAAQPETLQLFSFKDATQLYEDLMVKNHAKMIMKTFNTAINSLHDFDSLEDTLERLGKSHFSRNVTEHHYDGLAGAILTVLEGALGNEWNKKVKKAWVCAYTQLTASMKGDNYGEDLELTQKRIKIVQNTWNQIITSEDQFEPVGLAIFKEFFRIQPKAMNLFSFKHLTDPFEKDQVKDHAKKIIQTFDTAINSLHDYDAIEETLKRLGKTHSQRDITEENYAKLAQAILTVLEGALGSQWNNRVKKAWVCAYTKLTTTMKDYNKQKEFPRANDETVLDDSARFDDSMRGLINGEDDQSVIPVPNRKKGNMPEIMPEGKKEPLSAEEQGVKEHFLKRFRAEVDFHHKVAYRFEKAYRLGKKMTERKQTLNLEIIDCISEHSGYIEQDPMALFYCLFFCIYYKNEELVEFLRTLIHKIYSHEKIDKLLEYIDVNGIEKIRTVGEQINSVVYHMVFYQAIDDDLRIVYSQIFRQLRFIQMRDKDALQFLNQRDYELIKLSFQKYTTKLNLTLFFPKAFPMKSSTYRKYNQAYYEEIVINNNVEQRVAQNYRERFLVTAEDIYIVFQMYCKEDYDEQFQKTKKDEITHQEFVELFIICIKNDSFKIAILIYTLFLTPSVDMDNKMMDILMTSIKESVYFHEMKLFFLHEHFDVLTIYQMNLLVDIYQEILHHKESKLNPIVNQFNTIKISMLIYRICFKIEQKKIYSLITKCTLLKDYLIKSLTNYFEKQNNILVLYKLMSEPILHMSEKKDSLDIMFEMNMQELLRNPVVVEVLNLVYEGKYSVSSSALSMSQTFFCLFEMEISSLKSINERLLANIVNVGDSGSAKQTSLQYHIWKQSIQRREIDEMVFSVLINGVVIGIAMYINSILNSSYAYTKDTFGGDFGKRTGLFLNAKPEVLEEFCGGEIDHLKEEYAVVKIFYMLMVISCIGMFSSVVQKLVSYKYKDNVTLNVVQIGLEASITVSSFIFIIMYSNTSFNTLISDTCGKYIEIDAETINDVDHMYTMRNPRQGELDFRLIISIIIIQSAGISIMMLQRTQYLGELIMMLTMMQAELVKFFSTFGLIILIFVFIGRFLSTELKFESATFYEIILDLFNAFNGNQDFEVFKMPVGQSYIAIFMYLFKVLFMSLLAAMFINKYKQVWRNLDAYKRFNIIKMKNSVSFDKFIGGVTLTFFPVNILMLPFIAPVIALRNARASDFMLKCQYTVMMLIYCAIAGLMIIPLTPFLYLKSVINALFILQNNTRQSYKGQNIIQLLSTLFLGPVFICLSLIIDLLSLPNILMRDSRDFEHKYQLSTDRLNDVQIDVVMVTFAKIFYGSNFQGFKGKHMTLIELMVMHTKIFSIIENLHNLFCRGNKDYKEALSNVQDYNMTKILTRKCSIPDKGGDYKEGRCELDVIHAVQMDIEMYNYVDVILRKLRMGKLADEVKAKASNKGSGEGEEVKDAAADNNGGNEDDEDDETKKIEGIHAIIIGPDGVALKRNNSDVMNNFFIQFVCQSFTDIEKQLAELRTNSNFARQNKFEKVIEERKKHWKVQTADTFKDQAEKYTNFVKRDLGIKTQITAGSSTKDSDPQNVRDNKTAESSEGVDEKSKANSMKGNKKKAQKQMTEKNPSNSAKKSSKKDIKKSKTSK